METMTNEEKAREICGCGNCYHNLKESECLKDNGILCCLKPCLKNALQAMEWKDKQWADRFKKAFEGLWTASFNVDNLSSEAKTTIEFKLVTRE